jgi:hypothetical protein
VSFEGVPSIPEQPKEEEEEEEEKEAKKEEQSSKGPFDLLISRCGDVLESSSLPNLSHEDALAILLSLHAYCLPEIRDVAERRKKAFSETDPALFATSGTFGTFQANRCYTYQSYLSPSSQNFTLCLCF